jgi:hypothetical protein
MRFKVWVDRAAPYLFAAALAGWHYLHVRPLDRPFLDDSAIILKYLDNFARGCFYCYNLQDGPVFGVSGFAHGLLAGALAFAGVRPEIALIISNLLGAVAFYAVCVLIFRKTYDSTTVAILATLLLFAASIYARETFMTGMETPLHAAIVFAAILAFLARSPSLGILCAVAIISKLDAVAPVGILLLLDLARSLDEPRSWFRGMALRFVLPLGAWCAFAFLVFGSPVPQTLVAKQFFHPKASGGWFPFLQGMIGLSDVSGQTIAACGLGAIAIAVVRRRLSASAVLAVCAIATVIPYYFYNPGERMHWYYTLPELLALSSALAFPAALLDALPSFRSLRRVSFACAVCLAAGSSMARSVDSEQLLDWSRSYARLVETDRMAAGRALRAATPPGSTVYAGHGHIARESQRRVIDLSGLNSRFATDHELSLASMFASVPPAGIATHGLIAEDLQRRYRLELRESFYNVTSLGFEPFRVFATTAGRSSIASPLPRHAVISGEWRRNGLVGPSIGLQLAGLNVHRLTFGVPVARRARTLLAVGGTIEATRRCEVPAAPPDCEACTVECTAESGDSEWSEVTLVAADGGPVTVLDPVIVRTADSLSQR